MPRIKKPSANGTTATAATPPGEPTALARMVAQADTTTVKVATPPIKGREGKVRRRIGLKWTNGSFSVISIWQEDRPGSGVGFTDEYMVQALGQGFYLITKLDPTEKITYTVFLGREARDVASCSCKGFQGRGHCKHCAGLDTLIAMGKLS